MKQNLPFAAEFDVFLKDACFWPGDFLQDLLSVPTVDVASFAVGMPMFENSLSVPNPIAYLPQVGTGYTCNMVSYHHHSCE